MGGNDNNNRQVKKSFGLFSLFKGNKRSSRRVDDSWEDSVKAYKVWPSKEDRGHYVAEPEIDKRATAYIDKIKIRAAAQYAEHELQAPN